MDLKLTINDITAEQVFVRPKNTTLENNDIINDL